MAANAFLSVSVRARHTVPILRCGVGGPTLTFLLSAMTHSGAEISHAFVEGILRALPTPVRSEAAILLVLPENSPADCHCVYAWCSAGDVFRFPRWVVTLHQSAEGEWLAKASMSGIVIAEAVAPSRARALLAMHTEVRNEMSRIRARERASHSHKQCNLFNKE